MQFLDWLESIQIDLEGRYKYLVMRVVAEVDDDAIDKVIIRGEKKASSHIELVYEVSDGIKAARAQGIITSHVRIQIPKEDRRGGWIEVNSETNGVRVFGTSRDFGRANHSATVVAIKHLFPGYTFEVE